MIGHLMKNLGLHFAEQVRPARLSEMNQDCEPGQAEQEGTLRPTRTLWPKLIGVQIVVIVRHFMHGLPQS